MRKGLHIVARAVGPALIATGSATAAHAQVVSPMEQTVDAAGPRAVAQFTVANPYPLAQHSEFFVVGDDGTPVAGAKLLPHRRTLAPNARARLTVSVPLDGLPERRVYVCHAIEPRYATLVAGGTSYRGEVCSKLVARSRG